MEKIIKKLGEIEQVKGVWLWENGKWEENIQIPLDVETKNKFRKLAERCIAYIKEKELESFGYISQFDYLFFKKIGRVWLIIWANQDSPLSLLKIEVDVLLSEIRQEKKNSFFKKFKLW